MTIFYVNFSKLTQFANILIHMHLSGNAPCICKGNSRTRPTLGIYNKKNLKQKNASITAITTTKEAFFFHDIYF